MPTQVYPMFENALRAAAGESIDAHQVKVSDLWARFSACASENPYAWSPQPRTAEEIRTVTADNRMIGFPYPKLMNSNIQTDQAAALIMCSSGGAALDPGVARDRWVVPFGRRRPRSLVRVGASGPVLVAGHCRLRSGAALDLASVASLSKRSVTSTCTRASPPQSRSARPSWASGSTNRNGLSR